MTNSPTDRVQLRKAQILEQLLPAGEAMFSELAPEARRERFAAHLDATIALLQQSDLERALTLQVGVDKSGHAEEDMQHALQHIEAERAAIVAVLGHEPDVAALEALNAVERVAGQRERAVMAARLRVMTSQNERMIEERSSLIGAVQELSTPIVPVYEGVLVVPLVGSIDSRRAQSINEALLEAIAAQQADLVILDVTGILTMDTAVANHLMQAARAAALLGSQVILVGISAEVAQILVHLNIDLGSLVTLSNLQNGIEYALERLGLSIAPRR